ncbi:MAG: hypothetical protein L0227_14680, partial [Chloroflexi bacterium]|nr:hypothetical protein [Chloroflexota bacterium]
MSGAAWALLVLLVPFPPTGPLWAAPAEDPTLLPGTDRPVPPPDDAGPEERADYWFRLGRHLGEREEDYLGAAAAFERSIAIIRTSEALYNRAVAYDAADRPLDAIAAFEDYAAEVGAES